MTMLTFGQKVRPLILNTPLRRDTDDGVSGFTLVELMVVMAIMGLAAAAVIITMPNRDQAVREEADRLALRLAAVRDLAVVDGRGTSAVISPSGYLFEQRARGEWQLLHGRAFAQRDWPQGVSIGGAAGTQTRILFSRLGNTPTPQSVILIADDAREIIYVAASGEISRAR